jgi:Uma2 family endonuclease
MTLQHTKPAAMSDYRFTREEYHRMARSGLFEGKRVQLLHGRVVMMAPIGHRHGKSALKSYRALQRVFPDGQFTIRPQLPFIAADQSEPEPDLCVVAGTPDDADQHPRSALLIIEIADTTLAADRTEMAELYAQSGVADYWIVNLTDQVIEVYRHPHAVAGGKWTYDAPTIVDASGVVEPLARPGMTIPASELLP